jgi:hypothetical protein
VDLDAEYRPLVRPREPGTYEFFVQRRQQMRRFHQAHPGTRGPTRAAAGAFDLNAEMRKTVERDGAPEASTIIVHDR